MRSASSAEKNQPNFHAEKDQQNFDWAQKPRLGRVFLEKGQKISKNGRKIKTLTFPTI